MAFSPVVILLPLTSTDSTRRDGENPKFAAILVCKADLLLLTIRSFTPASSRDVKKKEEKVYYKKNGNIKPQALSQ